MSIELQHGGGGAGEELAVVADHDDARGRVVDEAFQPFQAGKVQVVGGLVEQQHVEAAEEQRGQTDPGGLSSGQRRHHLIGVDVEAEVGCHLGDAHVEVSPAERQPAVERRAVVVSGVASAGSERFGGPVEPGLCGSDTGSAVQEGRHGFPGDPLGLLRQQADGGVRWLQLDGPRRGSIESSQDPQQRGLAGTVRPDEPDHRGRCHQHVDAGEEGSGPVLGGQVAGHQLCAHGDPP